MWLIYLIVSKVFNKKAALAAAALFVLNIYSLIAGLQVDIDGAILPFFVLLGYYGYLGLLEGGHKRRSLFLLGLAIVGGLFTKESFVLFLAALILDYLFILHERNKDNFLRVLKQVLKASVPVLAFMALLFYFYYSRLHGIIDYAMNFKSFNFGSRAYLELGFKVVKSFVWLSPLLTLPAVFGLFIKEIRNRQRFWYLYVFVNLLFYLILFDFTKLTIERYFMFLIVPAVIITSDVLYYCYKKASSVLSFKKFVVGTGTFFVFALLIFSRTYAVLPLNPKTAYVEQVKNFDFNFLIPFSSGSGPIGFYFSAQFILWSWIMATLFLGSYLLIRRTKYKTYIFASFLIFGFGYNLIFMNELLRGSLYGSPDRIVRQTLNYVLKEPSITRIITYNDIAPYDLKKSGKYHSRFYTAPEGDYTKKVSAFRGHYMIVDFPAIYKNDRYWPLITRCPLLK
ncbi:MAG: glycosyltransferase family 39 protein, partial [bacterium]|nr:glycosyltransferase family 39 protein [bacterium]